MRERELKRACRLAWPATGASLPMRERELKPRAARRRHTAGQSLPMRERELKHRLRESLTAADRVAPHAGARIETSLPLSPPGLPLSLPMRERELKHGFCAALQLPIRSLPMRERELKHHGLQSINYWRRRSPRGSAISCNPIILLCSPTQYEHLIRKHCG